MRQREKMRQVSDDVLGVSEAAQLLGAHVETVRRLARASGPLKSYLGKRHPPYRHIQPKGRKRHVTYYGFVGLIEKKAAEVECEDVRIPSEFDFRDRLELDDIAVVQGCLQLRHYVESLGDALARGGDRESAGEAADICRECVEGIDNDLRSLREVLIDEPARAGAEVALMLSSISKEYGRRGTEDQPYAPGDVLGTGSHERAVPGEFAGQVREAVERVIIALSATSGEGAEEPGDGGPGRPKRKRGAPKRYDAKSDATICEEWLEAKGKAGETREEFAKRRGMSREELIRTLERQRKRR